MIKLKLQMFGGRGASSGMSIAGRKYGTEYKTLHVKDSVKWHMKLMYEWGKNLLKLLKVMK